MRSANLSARKNCGLIEIGNSVGLFLSNDRLYCDDGRGAAAMVQAARNGADLRPTSKSPAVIAAVSLRFSRAHFHSEAP